MIQCSSFRSATRLTRRNPAEVVVMLKTTRSGYKHNNLKFSATERLCMPERLAARSGKWDITELMNPCSVPAALTPTDFSSHWSPSQDLLLWALPLPYDKACQTISEPRICNCAGRGLLASFVILRGNTAPIVPRVESMGSMLVMILSKIKYINTKTKVSNQS